MRNRRQSGPKSVTAVVRTSRITALIAMFCCCSAAQMRAQGTSASTEVDRVRGVVINSVTREPVGRALVYSPDNAFATMTDDRGRFEFVFPRPEPEPVAPPTNGQLESAISTVTRFPATNGARPGALMARKIGYLPSAQPTDISQISPGHQDVTIKLVPEARIIGQVIIPGWDGSEKMQVEAYRRSTSEGREQWDMAGLAATRADGEFRIPELPSGFYKLLTLELLDNDPLNFNSRGPTLGFPPLYYPNASDFDSAGVIHLAPGETFQAALSPIRKPYYPVRVGLTEALASPQIQVKVWPQGRPGPGFSLGYHQREGMIQGSLPDGTYSLLVVNGGPTVLTGSASVTVRGAPSLGAPVTLLPSASIAVNVRTELQHTEINLPESNPDGPAPQYNPRRPNYLQLNLLPEEQFGLAAPAFIRPPTGPDDLALMIENVMPGRYRVRASSSGVGYVAAITSGGTDLLRLPLVVAAGASMPPLEVTVRDDGAQVDGTIVLPNSLNRPNARQFYRVVFFIPLDRVTHEPFIVPVAPDGEAFTVQQLAPGEYRVFALDRQPPDPQFADAEFMTRYASQIQTIRVVADQKLQIKLSLIDTAMTE